MVISEGSYNHKGETMETKYYLVYDQFDDTIYGVGRSIDGAYQDAEQWVEGIEDLAHTECTESLYWKAMATGGVDLCYSIRGGVAKLECAPKNS